MGPQNPTGSTQLSFRGIQGVFRATYTNCGRVFERALFNLTIYRWVQYVGVFILAGRPSRSHHH